MKRAHEKRTAKTKAQQQNLRWRKKIGMNWMGAMHDLIVASNDHIGMDEHKKRTREKSERTSKVIIHLFCVAAKYR